MPNINFLFPRFNLKSGEAIDTRKWPLRKKMISQATLCEKMARQNQKS